MTDEERDILALTITEIAFAVIQIGRAIKSGNPNDDMAEAKIIGDQIARNVQDYSRKVPE